MIARLVRTENNATACHGVLSVDGVAVCVTLEDPVREKKIKGVTAIPAGEYQLRFTYSPKFKAMRPEVMAVYGFTGVRIHEGNAATDTDGCILVGMERDGDKVVRSREALNNLVILLWPNGFWTSKHTLVVVNDFTKILPHEGQGNS